MNDTSLPIEYRVVTTTASAKETKHCASVLASLLRGSETITLDGDLGAGKTQFTQGLAAGLGIESAVTSPTFNILVVYDEGTFPLYHFDVYRLEKPEELEDIAFTECIESPGVSCIEWASKFLQQLPEERLEVFIETAKDNTRVIKVRGLGESACSLLDVWCERMRKNESETFDTSDKKISSENQNASSADANSNQDGLGTFGKKTPQSVVYKPVAIASFEHSDRGNSFVLAFDTANEMISVGLGKLDYAHKQIEPIASQELGAFRASNEKLVPEIKALLESFGVSRSQIACVVCGRGPGSFTGVRICIATAKGVALGLGVPLFGVSTLDAQAWQLWLDGVRGSLLVVGDAMRKEVYPVRYELANEGICRLNTDAVVKAETLGEWLGSYDTTYLITGDALKKYTELCKGLGTLTDASYWYPQARGLLRAAQDAWQNGLLDPSDKQLGDPCALLPVYTRLSDAEEHERIRFAKQTNQDELSNEQKNLSTGVQGEAPHSTLYYKPLEGVWAGKVAALEQEVMGSDAWNTAQILDELPRADRTWWAAYEVRNPQKLTVDPDEDILIGYAGGWIIDGQVQILKVASSPNYRRKGIARELIVRVALDARDLGASEMTLEVRASNTGAQAFYERLGLKNIGKRPHYYSDKEDAFIFTGPLPVSEHDVAGMDLRINEASEVSIASSSYDIARDVARDNTASPARDVAQDAERGVMLDAAFNMAPSDEFILAIESSCDETAVALIDGNGVIISDVVASQIDFHARFGGVVPEIASRKHIEAIGGVVEECLEQASLTMGRAVSFGDISAVAVTYAPGLVGALVVGMAFAKGLAWAIDVPLIGVNHLEGHIYANKLAQSDIEPPMVVSLVSGGHTMLVYVKDWGSYQTLGTTLDDAVGEAFDKVAKAMGLGYPGGPLISKLAQQGNAQAIKFPRALMHSGDLQFSLSGLKTSVMTYLEKQKQQGNKPNYCDVAASFQAAVVEVQVAKARCALEQTGAKEFCLGGGVAANPVLRDAYKEMCDELGVRLTMPPLSACGDNAAMIALVALDRFRQKKFFDFSCDVAAHASLDEPY